MDMSLERAMQPKMAKGVQQYSLVVFHNFQRCGAALRERIAPSQSKA
jgi:hypothetical protein